MGNRTIFVPRFCISYGKYGATATLLSALASSVALLLFAISSHSFLFICASLFGFLVYGLLSVLSLLATQATVKATETTALGFASLFSSFGGSLAGYPLILLTQHFGWDPGFFTTLVCSSFVASLMLLLCMRSVRDADKKSS